MSVFKGIKRYSVGFVFLFVLLSFGCVLAFLLSSEREVTFESCKKLDLPILELSTNKNKEITSKEDYVKGDFTLTDSSVVLTGKCKDVQNPNPAIPPVPPVPLPHYQKPSPHCSPHPSSLRYH